MYSSDLLLQAQAHGDQAQQQENADDAHQNTGDHPVPDQDHGHADAQNQGAEDAEQDFAGELPVDPDGSAGTDPGDDGLCQQHHTANGSADNAAPEGVPLRQQTHAHTQREQQTADGADDEIDKYRFLHCFITPFYVGHPGALPAAGMPIAYVLFSLMAGVYIRVASKMLMFCFRNVKIGKKGKFSFHSGSIVVY